MTSPILHLPDELLLSILSHISSTYPRKTRIHQRDLSNLSIPCKPLRPKVLEHMLHHPMLHPSSIYSLLHLLFHHPALASQCTILELSSSLPTPPPARTNLLAIQPHCLQTASSSLLPPRSKSSWLAALRSRRLIPAAYLSVLLSVLPNLTDLRVAATTVQDVGFSANLPRGYHNDTCIRAVYAHWNRITDWIGEPYLADISALVAARLERLELPLVTPHDLQICYGSTWYAALNLDCFANPKPELAIGVEGLTFLAVGARHIGEIRPKHYDMPTWNSTCRLPSSVQTLVVTQVTTPDCEGLLELLVAERSRYARLTCVELYFVELEPSSQGSGVSDALESARKVGITIHYHYLKRHPTYLNPLLFDGQPWRYTDAELEQIQEDNHRRKGVRGRWWNRYYLTKSGKYDPSVR
jgi:hypothetical protein